MLGKNKIMELVYVLDGARFTLNRYVNSYNKRFYRSAFTFNKITVSKLRAVCGRHAIMK
jgi:hypothetical protein